MTDDEFKKHLYKQLDEDKKNHGKLTNQLYKKANNKKPNKYSYDKTKQKTSN
jgi:hypothetical protein